MYPPWSEMSATFFGKLTAEPQVPDVRVARSTEAVDTNNFPSGRKTSFDSERCDDLRNSARFMFAIRGVETSHEAPVRTSGPHCPYEVGLATYKFYLPVAGTGPERLSNGGMDPRLLGPVGTSRRE
jgi:hypothetical protein